jgi:hypothetical protein
VTPAATGAGGRQGAGERSSPGRGSGVPVIPTDLMTGMAPPGGVDPPILKIGISGTYHVLAAKERGTTQIGWDDPDNPIHSGH